MQKLTIILSPVLAEEVYGRTVESGLVDHRSGNQNVGLTPADISLYEKIEQNSRVIQLDTIDEAASLYNELFNLVDFFYEWAEEEGVKWYSVARSAKKHMTFLRNSGVKTDVRGWAIQN